MMFGSEIRSSISWFFRTLQLPSSLLVGPSIFLITFLSATRSLFSSLRVSVQASEPYIKIGRITVL
ncbi:hypothetical protein JYU34_008383 [Plutella xylostella]|uniref:Uncharacterized protein n=1 Tax=Plutella xylostella TaxID=51655 RepID=A0ABQ7QL00_PLUXY|nr:hypothetical protein JYU34_008383 [Plutella xylostella]